MECDWWRGSFTNNEHGSKSGLSIYLDPVSQLSSASMKRYELAQQENISLEESLEFLVSGIVMKFAFQSQKLQLRDMSMVWILGEIARGVVNKNSSI